MALYIDGVERFRRQVEEIWEDLHHETGTFPANTNLTCTLAAHADQNTFGEWAEIVDGSANKLSAAFASYPGHIASMVVESVSEIDTIYQVEISYGADYTIITRWRFAGETKFKNPAHQLRVRAVIIPAGEAVYYRMKSAEDGSADSALVHFRYFLHE